jgi:hypothetical protein
MTAKTGAICLLLLTCNPPEPPKEESRDYESRCQKITHCESNVETQWTFLYTAENTYCVSFYVRQEACTEETTLTSTCKEFK